MKQFLILIALALSSLTARASLFIEPYGGYSVGKFSDTSISGTTQEASLDGAAYGGRAGFMLDHFLIVAYEYQGMSLTQKITGQTTSETVKQATQFATLGFQAPQGLRFMGGYGFNVNVAENNPATTLTGTAYKLTLGWQILHNVAINAEYTIYNMVNMTSNGITSKISDTYSKYNYSQTMVTISFPISFFHMGSEGGGGGGKSRGP